jgi:DNA-binding transcriptional regulator/RsmH inhibitor MraZ|tara:strand:+ start:6659 stop:6820 length:162 start_codon:yes stop_codon:yes gene_type:complete
MKLDKKGRLTIPKTFLDANNLNGSGCWVYMEVISSNAQSVRLTFDNVEIPMGR